MSTFDLIKLPDNYGTPVQLLHAVQQYDLTSVQKILRFVNPELINAPCGALHVTALQVSNLEIFLLFNYINNLLIYKYIKHISI